MTRKVKITKATMRRQGVAERKAVRAATRDSYQNFMAKIGIGTDNLMSASTYGFNPISRIRTLLEWMHRGTWLGGVAVDVVADDMTRAGIDIHADLEPDQIDEIHQSFTRMGVWGSINDTIKWARLYGGCIAVILIDGQDPQTPLRIETVGEGQFRGLLVLDRWMCEPSLEDLVTELGPELGMPKYYRVTADAPALRRMTIHYSRVVRVEGVRLPYWQRVAENLWGISVLERLYDRMVAFDSATQGAAQLTYKTHLRTYKLNGLRELMSSGGEAEDMVARQVDMARRFQSNEGMTLIDGKDDITMQESTSFAGIADIIARFGEQISGALQIPLVRLFGQSPAGLNSTGESDLRTYYDGIQQQQELLLREPMNKILRVAALSLGFELEKSFSFSFRPLWQLTEDQKSTVAQRDTQTILDAEQRGIISPALALKEMKQASKVTGRWTNITDEEIESADDVPAPAPIEGEGEGEGGPPEAGKTLEPKEPKEPKAPKEAKDGKSNVHRLRRGADARLSLPISEVAGLPVVIETLKGTMRSGDWGSVVMPADYGYIRRIGSAEGKEEWLDCFVGPDRASGDVWVVDACDPVTGAFDEHKLMLGFNDSRAALEAFRAAYTGDIEPSKRIMGVTHHLAQSDGFKDWLARGNKSVAMTKPPQRDVA